MHINSFLLFLGLFGLFLNAERQPGVQFTGLEILKNEEIQRECGKGYSSLIDALPKILRGKNVTHDEAKHKTKWMVSIRAGNDNRKGYGMCSGVLISRRHVLTAAHCQEPIASSSSCNYTNYNHNTRFTRSNPTNYVVRVYSRRGFVEINDGGRAYKVKKIIFPASYGYSCATYNGDIEDIAIYELMTPVSYPSFVCLANVELPFKTLTNYGYGNTGIDKNKTKEPYILKKHNVKYVDCKIGENYYGQPMNGQKCESHATEEVSLACKGDSGGPVVAEYYDRIFSAGVLVSGPACVDVPELIKDGTAIRDSMVSVPYYKNWICKWTGICVYGADPLKDKRPTAVWDFNGEKNVF